MYTTDTLNTLPDSLQLSEVSTKRSELYTAFYSRYTPLSNFHPSKFTCDGVDYLHSEQYFHAKKAESNRDFERATEIMKIEDPL